MNSDIYFNPVSKKRVSEVVYDQIFEKISSKELKKGDRLPSERDLAQQFGCGRPSVREALRMLQQDDLIEIEVGVNGGAVVKHSIMDSAIYPVQRLVGVGAISVSEMCAYRKFNDKACIELAIENSTADDIKKMQTNLFDYEKHLANPEKIHKIDKTFHKLLAEASHNNMCLLVAKIMTSISTDMYYDVQGKKDLEEINRMNKKAFDNHSRILNIIINKEVDKIDEIATESAQMLWEAVSQFGDVE